MLYLCNYNNVLVRKYVSLFILKIVGPLGRVSGFDTVGTSFLVKNVDNTYAKICYTFLDMKTRQV